MKFSRIATIYVVLTLCCAGAAGAANRIVVNVDAGKTTIDRHIYGQFAEHLGHCIYGGFWVGEDSDIPNTRGIRNDVVAALKELSVPNLRWPGGCFAEEYHWMDGIGPRTDRPSIVNTHWGGVTEDNSFGTHEFLDLCEMLDCEPYICGNVSSGTVRELAQWVEYVNSDAVSPMTELRKKNGRDKPWTVKYWAVGNENWMCGGWMRPEFYMDEYRRYATFCKRHGGIQPYRVACGPTANLPDDNFSTYHWTEVMMENETTRNMMEGLALHYYTHTHLMDRNLVSMSATDFAEKDWIIILSQALLMDDAITRHSALMDYHDPQKNVGLIVDEWGTWYQSEPDAAPTAILYQQNTLRDALVASSTLDIFHKHCQRVRMANIAQTVNVLQSMILTDDERMVLTPSYHVFKMYKVHQDALMLPVEIDSEPYSFGDTSIPAISASASKDDMGVLHVSITNMNPNENVTVTCDIRGMKAVSDISGSIITANTMQAHNDFGDPEAVILTPFNAFERDGGSITVRMPSKSVVTLAVK
jgi:alpha-L-arabinofuranosidase